MPPALPWWPTSGDGDSGVSNAASSDTPYFLAGTDLSGGRLGVIVDTGAWANL